MHDEQNPHNVEVAVKLEANVTGPIQSVTDVVCNAANFIGKILGPALSAAGGIVSDEFQNWRALNIQRLQEKWEKIRKERGASTDAIRHLPFSLGVRLIEGASREDDDDVQELWARLLDAATDPSRGESVRRVHVEILGSLSVVEAHVLRFIAVRDRSRAKDPINSATEALERFSIENRGLAIENLKRQGCIRLRLNQSQMSKVHSIRDVLGPGTDVSKGRVRAVLEAIAFLIADVSGSRDNIYLKPTNNGKKSAPELYFDLTPLGSDLLRLCEPNPIS